MSDWTIIRYEVFIDAYKEEEVAKLLQRKNLSRRTFQRTPLQTLAAEGCTACPALLGVWVDGNEPVCEFVEVNSRTAQMVNINPKRDDIFDFFKSEGIKPTPGSYVVFRNNNWKVVSWYWTDDYSLQETSEEQVIVTPELDKRRSTQPRAPRLKLKNATGVDLEVLLAYAGQVTPVWIRLAPSAQNQIDLLRPATTDPRNSGAFFYYCRTAVLEPGEPQHVWGDNSCPVEFDLPNGAGKARFNPWSTVWSTLEFTLGDKLRTELLTARSERREARKARKLVEDERAARKLAEETAANQPVEETVAPQLCNRFRMPEGKRGRPSSDSCCRNCGVKFSLHNKLKDAA